MQQTISQPLERSGFGQRRVTTDAVNVDSYLKSLPDGILLVSSTRCTATLSSTNHMCLTRDHCEIRSRRQYDLPADVERAQFVHRDVHETMETECNAFLPALKNDVRNSCRLSSKHCLLLIRPDCTLDLSRN